MPLLDCQNLHKSYGGKILLNDVSLSIDNQDKVGLIGRNGAGKSTLCRIVLQDEEADSGAVHRSKALRLGHLPQHDPFLPGETVCAFLERFSEQPEWTCAATAARFGIDEDRFRSELDQLSGGWRTRVKLSGILLQEPNLLLLDEPTNFLDLRTQLLLEDFLADWRGAALVVSHDRGFLQAVTTHTAELDRGRMTLHPAPVNDYLVWREEEQDRLSRENAGVNSKKKQLQRFIDSNRANANTASQARNKAKQLARLETHELISADKRPLIQVPQVEKRDGPACHMDNLAIGYDGGAIADNITIHFDRGERLAIVGDNGQGKTTLLRTLVGNLPHVGGSVQWTHGADLGCYAQHVYSSMDGERTVEQELNAKAAPGVSTQEVLNVAGGFLFSGDDAKKTLSVLSGGERARCCLAGMLLGKHTVLVLDEPTNHLDVESVDALAKALQEYAGTVLLASHDRAFIEAVATGVIEVRDGTAATYPGSWSDYLWRVQQELHSGQRPQSSGNKSTAPEKRKSEDGNAKRIRSLTKAEASAARKMTRCEEAVAQIDAEMEAKATDPGALMELQGKRDVAQNALMEAEEAWSAIAEELESLQ